MPFSLDEVLARVRSVLRRPTDLPATRAPLRFADLELDLDAHESAAAASSSSYADRVQPPPAVPREPAPVLTRSQSSIACGATTSRATATSSISTSATFGASSIRYGPPLLRTVRASATCCASTSDVRFGSRLDPRHGRRGGPSRSVAADVVAYVALARSSSSPRRAGSRHRGHRAPRCHESRTRIRRPSRDFVREPWPNTAYALYDASGALLRPGSPRSEDKSRCPDPVLPDLVRPSHASSLVARLAAGDRRDSGPADVRRLRLSRHEQ